MPLPPVAAERLAYRPTDAADVIGVSRTRLFELLGEGEIRFMKIGATTVIRREWLADFLDRREARAS